MTTIFRCLGLILAGVLFSASANAFTAKLEHLQPTGTVSATDDIPLLVRLTLEQDFDFSIDSVFPHGLSAGQIAATNELAAISGDVQLSATTKLSYAGLAISYSMANVPNHFLPAYKYVEISYLDEGWPGSLQSDNFYLDAGVYDFKIGTFRPKGPVEPGTYNAGMFSWSLLAIATDAITGQISLIEIPLASTCEKVSTCTFTRTVTAVPEPAALMYLGLGLLALGWKTSRRA